MIPGVIEGHNITLTDSDPRIGDIKAFRTNGRFITAWIPTPAEVAAINAGQPIYLVVLGESHPAVYVGVKP